MPNISEAVRPESCKDVPVAPPKFGVVKLGLSKKANVFLAAPVVIVP